MSQNDNKHKKYPKNVEFVNTKPSKVCLTCHRNIYRYISSFPPFTVPILDYNIKSNSFSIQNLNNSLVSKIKFDIKTQTNKSHDTPPNEIVYENIRFTEEDSRTFLSNSDWWNDNIIDMFQALFRKHYQKHYILLDSTFILSFIYK